MFWGNKSVLRLEGTSEDDLVQSSCLSRGSYSRSSRTVSHWVMNISENRDSTASLSTCASVQPSSKFCLRCFCLFLFLWSIFVCFLRNFVCFSLRLCAVTEPSEEFGCALCISPPMRYLYTLIRSHWPLSSPLWTITALSASPHMRDAPIEALGWTYPVNICLSWAGEESLQGRQEI